MTGSKKHTTIAKKTKRTKKRKSSKKESTKQRSLKQQSFNIRQEKLINFFNK